MIQDYNFAVSYLLMAVGGVVFPLKIPGIHGHLHDLLLRLALNSSRLGGSATRYTFQYTPGRVSLQRHLQWFGMPDQSPCVWTS